LLDFLASLSPPPLLSNSTPLHLLTLTTPRSMFLLATQPQDACLDSYMCGVSEQNWAGIKVRGLFVDSIDSFEREVSGLRATNDPRSRSIQTLANYSILSLSALGS
jgi:hypothetical protein